MKHSIGKRILAMAVGASISCFEKFGSLNGKTYEIVNADSGEVVASDTLPAADKDDAFSGECVHVISFDEVTDPGTYSRCRIGCFGTFSP